MICTRYHAGMYDNDPWAGIAEDKKEMVLGGLCSCIGIQGQPRTAPSQVEQANSKMYHNHAASGLLVEDS